MLDVLCFYHRTLLPKSIWVIEVSYQDTVCSVFRTASVISDRRAVLFFREESGLLYMHPHSRE